MRTLGLFLSFAVALVAAACRNAESQQPRPPIPEQFDWEAQERTEGEAQKIVARYDSAARVSNDPVAIWILALDEKHYRVVQTAAARLGDLEDPRAIEPLKRVIATWSPREWCSCRRGDSPGRPGGAAGWSVGRIEAAVIWKREIDSASSEDERIGRALALLDRAHDEHIYWRLRDLARKTTSERIIPFLIRIGDKDALKQLDRLRDRATPYLLQAFSQTRDGSFRQGAIFAAGTIKLKAAIAPMIKMLRDLEGNDGSKEYDDLSYALERSMGLYGEEILDDVEAEVGKSRDGVVRERFLRCAGWVGGPRSLALLKKWRASYPALEYFIERIESGHNP